MELRKISFERYKGYAGPVEVELAPLTILVGANNSGKSALAQVIQLLAGGLAPTEKDASEPLPLESGGIRHGETFRDLVTGCPVHGWLTLSATLADHVGELSLSATVRNVIAPNNRSMRQISDWQLTTGAERLSATRQGFDDSADYLVSVPETPPERRQISWRGLLPRDPDDLADWVDEKSEALKNWARGIRYLQCPRNLRQPPFFAAERAPLSLGLNGEDTPLALAGDDSLRESVRDWYRRVFGVSIDIEAQGKYYDLVVRARHDGENVPLQQSGRGLSHVLPVVAMVLTARKAGPGVDVIEHPEAELHPAAHADIAELLLENLAGYIRPMVVETHSEMVLLRVRRRVAERRLRPDDVAVYWIQSEPDRGSTLRRIGILETGEMESWPDGVFIEDYEEIMAIRRAARQTGAGE